MPVDTVAFVNPAYPNDPLIFNGTGETADYRLSCPWLRPKLRGLEGRWKRGEGRRSEITTGMI
jgi:hypothetical protein